MAAASWLGLATLLAWPIGASSNAVIDLDLFRGIKKADLGLKFENVDLASLPGLLSYVHTEVVGEHFPEDEIKTRRLDGKSASAAEGHAELDGEDPDEDEEMGADHKAAFLASTSSSRRRGGRLVRPSGRRRERTSRHKGIDTIVRTAFKVKNPVSLLNSPQVKLVDFGPGVKFTKGEAQTHVPKKGGYGRLYKWDYGDFVGAAQNKDRRFPTSVPGFWFSFSGFCPNLKWVDKLDNKTGKLHEWCMGYGLGRYLMGGLCNNTDVPDGSLGCTYTYEKVSPKSTVSLDELSGLTEEDCGGRKCRSWQDFRKNCTNTRYKRMFNYRKRGAVTKTRECIEYDIHPACQRSCSSLRCKALPNSRKEVGLPFWLGRCSAARNAWRTEQFALKFGIAGATVNHTILSPRVRANDATCLNANRTSMCSPRPELGYMYCTRHWAGVCEACYIPNTERSFPQARRHPMCPWNVLGLSDYVGQAGPHCRSQAPRDLCCLYAGTCNVTAPVSAMDAASAVPLDEDGYAIMTSKGSTEAMKAFLVRCHQKFWQGELVDEEGLATFAYWQWNAYPIAGRTFAHAVRGSKGFFVYPTTTTTSTVTGTVHPGGQARDTVPEATSTQAPPGTSPRPTSPAAPERGTTRSSGACLVSVSKVLLVAVLLVACIVAV